MKIPRKAKAVMTKIEGRPVLLDIVLYVVLYVVLYIVIGALFYFGLKYIYPQANENVLLIVNGSVISFIVFIVNNREIKKREIASRHFEGKVEAYKPYVNLLIDLISGKNLSPEELKSIALELKKEMVQWSSSSAIHTLIDFETYSAEVSTTVVDDEEKIKGTFDMADKVLLAIRKDLGHNDFTMREKALLKLMLDLEGKEKMDKIFRIS